MVLLVILFIASLNLQNMKALVNPESANYLYLENNIMPPGLYFYRHNEEMFIVNVSGKLHIVHTRLKYKILTVN